MKIVVIISSNIFFANSASANRSRTLVEVLSLHGVEIELLITGGFSSRYEFKEFGFKGCFKNIKYRYLFPLFNDNIWLKRVNSYIILPLLEPYLIYKILQITGNERNSVIWPSCNLVGLKSINKIKRLYPAVNTFLELSEFLDIHRFNKGRRISNTQEDKVLDLFEKSTFYQFDIIALMTKALLNYYDSFPKPGPDLIHLPMTVDLDRFKSIHKAPLEFVRPYIAFVGAMNDLKEGISILISAFNEVKDIRPEMKLYLVGPRHYDTELHLRIISELNLRDRVFWMGEYSRDEIPGILQNAELLVMPRPDSRQARGGFPTKLGEYLASGVPVCATDVGEISDYLVNGESVFFAKPDSVDSLADALSRALINREIAKRIGMNGRKVAELNFDKDIVAKKLIEFFISKFPRWAVE